MLAILFVHALNISTSLLAMQSGSAHLLQRQLRPGDVDDYNISVVSKQVMSMGQMGEKDVTVKMELGYVLKTGRLIPSKHAAEITSVTTTRKMDMGDMGAAMGGAQFATQKPITVNGTIDSRNHIWSGRLDNASVPSMMNPGGTQGSLILIEFPDHPVKTGDSWQMEVSGMEKMGVNKAHLRVTLLGSDHLKGHPTWKVKVAGKFPLDMDLGKMMGALSGGASKNPGAAALKGMSMKMKGTMDYSGIGMIDQKTGKTLSFNYVVGSDIAMDVTSMKMQMVGKSINTVTLKGY
jgi:hypothetical protein